MCFLRPRYIILDERVRKKGSIAEFLRRKGLISITSDIVKEFIIVRANDGPLSTVIRRRLPMKKMGR
jgi:hypothetical protein